MRCRPPVIAPNVMARGLSCVPSREVIRRADHAFHTHTHNPGQYVSVAPWRCRAFRPVAGGPQGQFTWLNDCKRGSKRLAGPKSNCTPGGSEGQFAGRCRAGRVPARSATFANAETKHRVAATPRRRGPRVRCEAPRRDPRLRRRSSSSMGDRSMRLEARFEKPLIAAAVLSIPATILQVARVRAPWDTVGQALNWIIWVAFLAEIVVLLAVVPDRRGWLRAHPLEIVIVLLTPPFFLSTVQGVRVLRVLRIARLLRLAPLARAAFSMEGVRFVSAMALLTAIAGGAGFASLENVSFGNGLYWAATTMTTVGYGDITPKTPEARVLAVVVMLVGIGTATLLIGAVAQRFIAHQVREVEVAEEDMLAQVRDISERLRRLERALEQHG